MKVLRFASASAFLDAAQSFLLRAEAENSLLLGIAGDLAAGRGPDVTPSYFAAGYEGGEITVCAFSTIPEKVGLTRAANPAMLAFLADDVLEACPEMRVILAPEPTARDFATAIEQRLGTPARLSMGQRIHQLTAVEPMSDLPGGRLRPARPGDLGLLTGWVAEFMAHAGDRGDPGEVTLDRISRELLYVWETEAPVSMAAWTGRTPNGVRVNYVYTPPSLRGRGYATACVAQLSRLLLETSRFCCLYTDLANPTSNAIYHRIGYRPVCDASVYSVR